MASLRVKDFYPYYVANKPTIQTSFKKTLPVLDKFSQKVVSHVALADEKDIENAISCGVKAEKAMRELPSFQRKEILLSIADKIKQQEDEIAHILAVEVGKTIKEAKVEVGRAVDTFTLSAEEAVRRSGKFSFMDISPRNKGFMGITARFPVGLISMVTPFNFPLNLAAHKIGPAIAVGCPFVLKPSERTPISSIVLAEILSKTSLPDGSFSVLPCLTEHAKPFSSDDRIKLLSFTGSAAVGWRLKNEAGKKRVSLELGGNAACIVDEDVSNIDNIVSRILFGAFYQAGQSCISVQRVYVHDRIYDEVRRSLIEGTKKLKVGSPFDDNTFVGPLISEHDAKRIEQWVNNSVQQGATLLVGGKRNSTLYEPTIIENAPYSSDLVCKEAFGPVFTLEKFKDFKEVINTVNDSRYGLQTGIFTRNINKAFYGFQNLHVGGVVINDIPSARVDSQPYGGIKDSGLGREGIEYAMEDFTEVKVMTLKDIDQL